MRVIDLINVSTQHLESRGFENARLEVERMLGNVLGLSRLGLYLAFERLVSDEERGCFRNLYRRRLAHEPLQHILGTSDFREITLKVDRRALVPRSETEMLVEIAVDFLGKLAAPLVADLGTGSGVIAISIACELPESRVIAVDISDEALMLAEENVRRFGLEDRVVCVAGNMLESLGGHGPFDAIVSNPPYVKSGDIPNLQPEVRDFDPHTALDGGEDGFRFLTEIVAGAHRFLRPGGLLLLECGVDQAERVQTVLEDTNRYSAGEIVCDLAGKQRIIKALRD